MRLNGRLTLTVFLAFLLGFGWFNRLEILLALVKSNCSLQHQVGPAHDVPLEKGPTDNYVDPGQRLPNIILIVANDLGYNDISTFGRGIA